MKRIFWFFREGEALYEDQCLRALNEGRIQEVDNKKFWDMYQNERHDLNPTYTPVPYEQMLEEDVYSRPFTVLSEQEWTRLVAEANQKQMDIVNNPETNLPMLAERVPVEEPTKEEQLRAELADIDVWFDAHEYIGTKIATGRATRKEYSTEIAEMQKKADRKNEILALLGETK